MLVQTVNAQTRIAELHRRIEFSDAISHEQLAEQMSILGNIVVENVKDRETIEAIVRGIDECLGYSFLEEGGYLTTQQRLTSLCLAREGMQTLVVRSRRRGLV